jgi:hypothetical protein
MEKGYCADGRERASNFRSDIRVLNSRTRSVVCEENTKRRIEIIKLIKRLEVLKRTMEALKKIYADSRM